MWDLSASVYNEKKRALVMGDDAVREQIGRGKDILSIMLRENMKASSEDRLDEKELIGQHPEVQAKLRKELANAREENCGQDLGYDQLVSLPYLDAICRETLRLYPPVPRLMRVAVRDAVVPLAKPVIGTDGVPMTEVFIPADSKLYLSVLGSNRNTEMWGPDALEWKPERWLSPLPQSLTEARIPGVYSHLMTFNAGSRSCIGFKFSQLEMKNVLSHLIENFEFSPSKKNIYWEYTAICNPVVREEGPHSQLPVIVSRVKKL
ncbi:hypothetical protein V5O48_005234 [Marasmius crinis-equi]|uniref:Cytochrome P450 n=1 Tax=Marasmius crinis-equi TaxID=585013 RepID=A0ABR3FMW0_9AGAR